MRCRGKDVVRNEAGASAGATPEGPSLCCWEFGLHSIGNAEPLKGFKQGGSVIRCALNDACSDSALAEDLHIE